MPVHPKHYAYANSGALIFVIGVGIAVIAVADFALLTKVLLAFSWFWVAGFISEKLLSGYVNRVVELLSRP